MSATSKNRSILLLSYLFPPRGGAGVQRPLKFAKYLPDFGWQPHVIASGGGADDKVTAQQDKTLLCDLPEAAEVRFTELNQAERSAFTAHQSRLRQRFFATDPIGWWVAPAVRTGFELAASHRPDVIMVTMSPFTAAAAGLALKARLHVPLVLDLRDPWALDETRIYPTRWHAWRDRAAMARALSGADAIIMNTPESTAEVVDEFRPDSRIEIECITNGYDADDFAAGHSPAVTPPPADRLRIVHTGMFHSELARVWDDLYAGSGLLHRLKYPRRPINLWTRTPRYLLDAIQRAIDAKEVPLGAVELVLVGELTHGDRELVQNHPAGACANLLGYRSHAESVGWVKSADLLFLPNHTPLDGEPALIVPGKTYEYLGSGRPILAMGPPGDMRDFVTQCAAGFAIGGDDVAAAAAVIARVYSAKQNGLRAAAPDMQQIADRFERRQLTRRLAALLDRVVERGAANASHISGRQIAPLSQAAH